MNEPRRYLTGDADQARVELVVRGPGGNGDYYISIVPEGHRLAWLADVSPAGEDLHVALGPHATVRVVTSGEPSRYQGVAAAVAQLYRAMGGEVRREMLAEAALPEANARAALMHRRAQALEGIAARLERVRAGYERLVAYLRRDAWRERKGAHLRFRKVYDALKAAGWPWGTPHPTEVIPNTNGRPRRADAVELIGMLAAERDAYRAMALGPVCEACDYETATNKTPRAFHACDEHRSPDSVDLPYAAALRAIVAREEMG